MKILKTIIAIILVAIAAVILDYSLGLNTTSAVHQIYVNGLEIKALLVLILAVLIWK